MIAMRYSSIAIALAVFVSAPAPALAAPPPTPTREDCGAQQNQTEMTACFGRDLQRADDRLNAAYAKRLDGMRDDPDGLKLLRAAERSWVEFREKTCVFQAHGEEGGSVYPTIVATCRIKMTEERIKDIQPDN
jgi:uncharacterized protein YecT (DUF1311 family)